MTFFHSFELFNSMYLQKPSKTSTTYETKDFRSAENIKHATSLLYLVFQTAFCFSVVSGCFVHGVSPSSRFRPELAPKRGLGGPGLAFRRPESARKVHAKSFGPWCCLEG